MAPDEPRHTASDHPDDSGVTAPGTTPGWTDDTEDASGVTAPGTSAERIHDPDEDDLLLEPDAEDTSGVTAPGTTPDWDRLPAEGGVTAPGTVSPTGRPESERFDDDRDDDV